MLIDELHGTWLIFVFVLLIAFLFAYIGFDGRTGFFPSRNLKLFVDLTCSLQSIGLEFLKLHLIKVSFGDELLLLLVGLIKLGVGFQNVDLHLLLAEVLQFERLNGIVVETARTFEHGVRITHQVDELRIREHLDQSLNTAGVRRILGQILGAAGVPERNLDQFQERFLEHTEFFGRNLLERQILVAIFLHAFREEPEVVVGIRHHVRQGKLFFLRQIGSQLHVVGRTLVGHQPAHGLLEHRLSEHHQMRKHGLIGRGVAEMFVLGENVVHERRAAAPVS